MRKAAQVPPANSVTKQKHSFMSGAILILVGITWLEAWAVGAGLGWDIGYQMKCLSSYYIGG